MEINQDQYNDFRQDFIKSQEETLRLLKTKEIGRFESLDINCSKIDEYYSNGLLKDLGCNGITNKSRVLYYFTILNPEVKFISTVEKLKKSGQEKMALPQLNKGNKHTGILYVGKCNTNFLSRFQYHLGNRSTKSTYALHLRHWAKDLVLQLRLYYSLVELEDKEVYLLEMLESVLHQKLKPVLGREGH